MLAAPSLVGAVARRSPWRARLVVAGALASAACGLVYELALLAVGSAISGATVEASSLTLGAFLASMGVGALAAKRLRRDPVRSFVGVEAALAVVGGGSTLATYLAFAYVGADRLALVAFAGMIGALIGAEIPLLIDLIGRLREADAAEDAADLMAADYAGSLLAGLAFPFLLVPAVGIVKAASVAAFVNLGAALVVAGAVEGTAGLRRALAIVAVPTLALVLVTARSDDLVVTARQQLYDAPIVLAETSRYQDIVVTSFAGDVRLYLNGDLQLSSVDEYRYHEALVHPAMADAGAPARVAVLGGGDGLALREVLRWPSVEEVVHVELDPEVVEVAQRAPELAALHGGALDDRRVDRTFADAFRWVREHRPGTAAERFDVVIVDMPDPDGLEMAKLYSVEFYGLLQGLLAPEGRLVVQAGSPFFAPEAYWSVAASLEQAGWRTAPLHVDVPSFGDWGFHLAAVDHTPSPSAPVPVTGLRFWSQDLGPASSTFPLDRARAAIDVRPSTLTEPWIVEATRRGWRHY